MDRLLIVDDEQEHVHALRRQLHVWARQRLFGIDSVRTGARALQQLEHVPYSVVLTDNRMPGMSGVELVRVIAQRYPDTVCLMISGYSGRRDLESAFTAGVYGYLMKPWDSVALTSHLNRAAEEHENRRRWRDTMGHLRYELRAVEQSRGELLKPDGAPPDESSGGAIVASFGQKTAEGAASGNYVDFAVLDTNRYAVLLGDVPGDGLQSAVVSAILKKVMVRRHLREDRGVRSPADFLTWLNRNFCDMARRVPEVLVMLSVSIVDARRRTVTTASAGMPSPLLRRSHTVRPLETPSAPLGASIDTVYQDTITRLAPGEELYLTTKGLWLPNSGDGEIDRDSIFHALLETRASEPVDAFVTRLTRLNRPAGDGDVRRDYSVVRLVSRE